MTGPEHYREAEAELDLAEHSSGNPGSEVERYHHAAALIHATLALAAATAIADIGWLAATGTEDPQDGAP